MEYYIVRDGTQFGPLQRAQVAAGLRGGEFSAADLYWHDGMVEWSPLSDSIVAVEAAASDEEAAPPGPAMTALWIVAAAAFLGAGGWLAAAGFDAVWTAWAAYAWPTAPATVTVSDAAGGRVHVAFQYEVDGERFTADRVAPGERFLLPAQARALVAAYPAGSPSPAHYQPSAPGRAFLDVGLERRTGAPLACGAALLWIGLGLALAAWLLPRYGVRRHGRFRLQRGSPPARFAPFWGIGVLGIAALAAWMAF